MVMHSIQLMDQPSDYGIECPDYVRPGSSSNSTPRPHHHRSCPQSRGTIFMIQRNNLDADNTALS